MGAESAGDGSSRFMNIDQQFAYLTRGCVDVVRPGELRERLERSATTGRPLVVKAGFDPTAPDLHLGHTVLIRKMKHFQELGHRVVYVVGAFTALIGDPTGRSKTRPPLTREEIDRNADTYKTQIFKILDPARTEVRINSEWLEPLGSFGWIRLAAKYNVAQMLERRDFRKRFETGQPIAVHEFLYPLGQAYDSVVLEADVELGGTDQLFNLNVGRDIMPAFDLAPQIVMTTPLLEGLDGVEKMSKSLGNYVGVMEPPFEMFGKLMSISDDLMWKYYALLTDLSDEEVSARRAAVVSGRLHPKDAKVELARAIVRDYHGSEAAEAAAEEFARVFSRRELPSDMPVIELHRSATDDLNFGRLLAQHRLAASASDAARKIQQRAVSYDGTTASGAVVHKTVVSHATLSVRALEAGQYVLRVGRRPVRLVVRD